MEVDYSLFTEKARATLKRAFTMARDCQYALVEPPIMMASLLQEGREMVAFLLGHLQVDRVAFCTAIGALLQGIPRSRAQAPVESPELEQVFAQAIALAGESGSRAVALEHIFWAMAVVPGVIRDIMERFGISKAAVKNAVVEFRGGVQSVSGGRPADESGTTTLRKYATNLVKLAEAGEIEPAVGRDAEIRRVLQILSRRTKNNPLLVGEPGTGKTAIVEGLAHRILRGDVPLDLKGIRLYGLDLSALVAGSGVQGEFEERLKQVVAEAVQAPDVVLFIDEFHTLIGAGRCSGAMDAANILKPELARGKLKVIGATTLDEYRKYIEKDKAFERRFQKVVVDEPDEASAVTILRGIKSRFENHHRLKILDEAVVAAVKLSARYIPDRFLPDKAIDLLDEAASRMRIERSSVPKELDELTRTIRNKEVELESIRQDGGTGRESEALQVEIANLREKENGLNAKWRNERGRFEQLQSYHDQIAELQANRELAEQAQRFSEVVELDHRIQSIQQAVDTLAGEIDENGDPLLKTALDAADIREVVRSWTGIPVAKMKEDEAQDLLHLETRLGAKVIGQKKAISAVAKVIRRNRAGLNDAARPIGSFLFLGSTGVGKTELAKALSEYLFNGRDAMVRIDMSEYQQEHSVSRLFGAPPGYVGYDQGGQLTEAVRRKPYRVVLFDEIEKAHPKVFETLLQVLDEGRLTDGQGRTVDFKNTIIIMTSNLGQEAVRENLPDPEWTDAAISRATSLALEQLKHRVAPEFINRIDEVVLFLPLTRDEIKQVVELQLGGFAKKLEKQGLTITFDAASVDYLAGKSFIPEYGARPVKRAIDEYIINPLSTKLLGGEVDKSRPIAVSRAGETLVFGNNG
ncbi:MAG: ATP-dependent Clp protease ATP-binding subunit [Kiritimatiellia bacterium]